MVKLAGLVCAQVTRHSAAAMSDSKKPQGEAARPDERLKDIEHVVQEHANTSAVVSTSASVPDESTTTADSPAADAGNDGALGTSSGPARGGCSLLEPDVLANVHLAWAKLYLARLIASHERYIDKIVPVEPRPFESPDSFPSMLAFRNLVPFGKSVNQCGWGDAALVRKFDDARNLFNAAMTHFKEALEYYQLDGWVTEHINILMEISNAYRCLASFEPDAKRKRLMHSQRVARLAPLHGVLNHEHFLGLVRSIALELGNTSREIMDLLEEERRPKSKTVAARLDAVRYYTYFIDTFREPFGPGGKLPDRIEDEANERYFLLASFSLGRLMSGGMAADRDMAGMVAAVEHLRGTAAYVDRQHVQHFEREAGMAREMADLISEKLQLAQQLTTAK
uniref:KIF-binding protein n=1 Tax=Chlamydomonas euryale TaxID=1486919 RepID=A0A7R9YQ70_9CHLO|mmetsp:Transcript_10484/g.31474  ORF Transcript_10484/g.31474 Transcript_10484/m.31474 type:complete len:395 (+) Transcript_10484:967-2151(+)